MKCIHTHLVHSLIHADWSPIYHKAIAWCLCIYEMCTVCHSGWLNICQSNYCPAVTDFFLFTFSLTRRTFVFVEHFPNEGESHSPDFASFLVPFHPLQRMKLVRLCPLLPRQQTWVYWVHAGLTKSTDFPRTIRKRNKRQRGLKEDWSNKNSAQRGKGKVGAGRAGKGY